MAGLIPATAMALCLAPASVAAQTAEAPALKAAFVYNFVKFTEWPREALGPADPLVLCVLNDRAVGEMLTTLTKGRTVDGHALMVVTLKTDAVAWPTCRVLFAAGLDDARMRALIESVAGRPILTVGDIDGFGELGGIVGFFVENGSLRFTINLDAAQRAGVRLSSKLLTLARIVKDGRNVTRH